MLDMESAKLIAKQTGGKLTAEDVINLATYGTTNAQDMAPDLSRLQLLKLDLGECPCGVINCPDAYSHTTSGW